MVKKIPLSQGKFALVDNEDFDFLNQWKWHAYQDYGTFYARNSWRQGKKVVTTLMHRLLLKTDQLVDHINGDGLDNRKSNLRAVTPRQNTQNRRVKGASKYPGVRWNKSWNKWYTTIKLNGNEKYLGSFDDEREAAIVYEKACRELCGEELVCKTHKKVNTVG